jgi:hypothetical protein
MLEKVKAHSDSFARQRRCCVLRNEEIELKKSCEQLKVEQAELEKKLLKFKNDSRALVSVILVQPEMHASSWYD